MKTKKGKSDKTLLSALDESMENIFGKSAAQAVYYHLEKSYLLKPEEIPEKPRSFTKAIEGMFGENGAEVIETLLVKDLLTKLRDKEQGEEAIEIMSWLDKLKTAPFRK